jgi:hypothetical protein
MIYPFWRLSEDTPDNLGLACTDHGLLLGQTLLIERHDGTLCHARTARNCAPAQGRVP